jgi:hypothetical protein
MSTTIPSVPPTIISTLDPEPDPAPRRLPLPPAWQPPAEVPTLRYRKLPEVAPDPDEEPTEPGMPPPMAAAPLARVRLARRPSITGRPSPRRATVRSGASRLKSCRKSRQLLP